MGTNHFTVLYDELTKGLPSAFNVTEACLRFATLTTRDGHLFDSAAWRGLDEAENLRRLIPGHVWSGLTPLVLQGIADTIAKSNDQPLAAWVTAMLISTAISQNFAASDPNPPEYTLQDLQGFAVPASGTSILYGGMSGLSAKPGPNFNQNNPSAVSGLALWRKEPLFHGPFSVVVDKTCGAQFDACVGDDNTLKVALIQPNKYVLELCVTTVSPQSDPDPRFFGVRPVNETAQTTKVLEGLKLAADAGAGVALLPELVMTEDAVDRVVVELGTPGNVFPQNAGPHTLRVVVSGSYHHVEGKARRNSTQVHFPRTDPMLHRQHSKSGKFVFTSLRAVMEAWSCDPQVHQPAQAALKDGTASKTEVHFREDVTPTHRIRLFSSVKFSAVVVICADLLNTTFRNVLETLQPSLVLVCNMTQKDDDFASAAHELILACQSTLVAVNNPAYWQQDPSGGMVGMPLQDQNKRVIEAPVPDNKILIFDPTKKQLQPYPP